tara:strand:- start:1902 stop:2027 length:126 start_codon:yes stop_codon:yes gene_type:complete
MSRNKIDRGLKGEIVAFLVLVIVFIYIASEYLIFLNKVLGL